MSDTGDTKLNVSRGTGGGSGTAVRDLSDAQLRADLGKILMAVGVVGPGPWPVEVIQEGLRKWQERQGIAVTGVYDEATQRSIDDLLRFIQSDEDRRRSYTPVPGDPNAQPGEGRGFGVMLPPNASGDGTTDGSTQPATAAPEATDDAAPAMTDEEARLAILRDHPEMAPFADHPELGPLLLRAVREEYTPEQFQAELYATQWWKTTAETARQWEAETRSDPATARSRLFATVGEIDRLARQNGFAMNPHDLYVMAGNALRMGWTEADVRRAIAAETRARAKQPGGLPAGDAANLADRLGSMARAYMVPMSRAELEEWAIKVQEGTATQERFQSLMVDHARDLYGKNPAILAALARGDTTSDFFGPYRSLIAETLELNPGEVDLMNPRWADVLGVPDKDGASRPMTLPELGRHLRGTREFRGTDTGNALGAGLNTMILRTFGELAS